MLIKCCHRQMNIMFPTDRQKYTFETLPTDRQTEESMNKNSTIVFPKDRQTEKVATKILQVVKAY